MILIRVYAGAITLPAHVENESTGLLRKTDRLLTETRM
jgi:hypothetical protein